jgi:hypothetical protein
MITNIIAACGTPVRNPSAFAMVSDKPDSLFIKKKHLVTFFFYDKINELQTLMQ